MQIYEIFTGKMQTASASLTFWHSLPYRLLKKESIMPVSLCYYIYCTSFSVNIFLSLNLYFVSLWSISLTGPQLKNRISKVKNISEKSTCSQSLFVCNFFLKVGSDKEIRFRLGRRDCLDPDNPQKHAEFPEGDDPNAIIVLQEELRITRTQAIALLGNILMERGIILVGGLADIYLICYCYQFWCLPTLSLKCLPVLLK